MKSEQISQIEILMQEELDCARLPFHTSFTLDTIRRLLTQFFNIMIFKELTKAPKLSLLRDPLLGINKNKAIFIESPSIIDLLFFALKLTDTVCFISRDDSSPLRKLQKKFEIDRTQKIEIAQTGNSTLILLATRAHTQVVVHYGSTAEAIDSIERQKKGLICCRNLFQDTLGEFILPRIEDAQTTIHDQWLIQTRIQGQSGQDIQSSRSFLQAMQQTIDLSLDSKIFKCSSTPPHNFVQNLITNINKNLEVDLKHQLQKALSIANKWLITHKRGSCFVHGDLWLGNVIFNDRKKLNGIIDWEWFAFDAPPIFDAIHCLIVSYANFRKTNISKILPMLWSVHHQDAIITNIMAQIFLKSQYSHVEQRVISVIVWLHIIYKSHIKTGPRSKSWLSTHITELSICLRQNSDAFESSSFI